MTAETTIQKYADAWAAVISFAKLPLVWAPFAALAVLKTVSLVLLYFFWKAPFSGFMMGAIESVFGERAVHFPAHVLLLPDMYGVLDMTLMVALGFVLVGWATTMMVDRVEGNSIRASRYVAPTLFFIPALLLVGLVFVCGVDGIPALVSHASSSVASPRLRSLLGLFGLGSSLIIKGILMYWPAYLVLSRGRVLVALVKSWRCARTWPWFTGMVVVTSWLMKAPLDYVISQPASLMQNSGADAVFGVLTAGVFLEALGFFYLFGAAASVAVENRGRE